MGLGGPNGAGLPPMLSLQAASTLGTVGTRYDLDTAYDKWALRVKLNGNATGVVVQLKGAIASSSDANGALVALTTWSLQAPQSCDDTVFITGKPVTSVLAEVTSLSSTGTTVTAWISGCR